jgi:hypothetical protein
MKTRLSLGPLWLASLLVWQNLASGQVRVAIVSTDTKGAAANVQALAEAHVSANPGVVVVDRVTISRVLSEQAMSLSGLVSADSAVKAGRLLNVDLFVVVQGSESAGKVVGVIVFHSGTGVRLADAAVDASDLKAAAAAVSSAVEASQKKLAGAGRATRSVCLLAVRNVDLGFAGEGFCRSVGTLLQRHLANVDGLAVLERERLDHINKERTLPGSDVGTNLLASMIYVELDVSRAAGKKTVQIVALLTDAAGRQMDRIPVTSAEEAVAATDALQRELCSRLNAVNAPRASDRALEARRFMSEQQMWWQRDKERFTQCAETAYALDPNVTTRENLIGCYVALSRIEEALGLCEEIKSRGEVIPQIQVGMKHYLDYGIYNETREVYDHKRPERLANGRRYLALLGLAPDDQPLVVTTFRTMTVEEALEIMAYASDRSSSYIKSVTKLMSWWIASMKAEAPPSASELRGVMMILRDRLRLESSEERARLFPKDATYYNGMASLYAHMQKAGSPLLQLYGQLGGIACDRGLDRIDEAGMAGALLTWQTSTERLLNGARRNDPAYDRYLIYGAMLDASRMTKGKASGRHFQRIFDFMIARKELAYPVVAPASESTVENCDRMLATLKSPDCERLPAFDPGFIKIQRDKLAAASTKAVGVAPWKSARLLFNAKDYNGCEGITTPVVSGDNAYVLAKSPVDYSGDVRKMDVTLLRVSLTGGGTTIVGRTAMIPPRYEYDQRFMFRSTCLGSNAVYVATHGDGIYVYGFDGSVRQITEKDGLPSPYVYSVACVGDKIYAGLGKQWKDAYIVVYNTASGTCELVAAASRRERITPFDNSPDAFAVCDIKPDAARNRLILVVGYAGYSDDQCCQGPLMGLWAWYPSTGKMTQVFRRHEGGGIRWLWTGSPDGDHFLLVTEPAQNAVDLLDFNMRNDETRGVFSSYSAGMPLYGIPSSDFFISTQFSMRQPFLRVGNWLWHSNGRVSRDGQTNDAFPPHKVGDTARASWTFLEKVHGGTAILAADDTSLWLLELGSATDASEKR